MDPFVALATKILSPRYFLLETLPTPLKLLKIINFFTFAPTRLHYFIITLSSSLAHNQQKLSAIYKMKAKKKNQPQLPKIFFILQALK